MPSTALQDWRSIRSASLDEIEGAHRSVGGSGPGRRYTTQQLNRAYAMLLSSEFQGVCRDLHTECVGPLTSGVVSAVLRSALELALIQNRKLDRGNPNPGNIGADFNRFGLVFWSEVVRLDSRNQDRQERLEALNHWRNAIAHQDFDPAVLGSTVLRLQQVREWRQACDFLAAAFDEVMRRYIQAITGSFPW